MASRGTYGLRPAKSAEKEREKSRIPIIGLSRKSSVTSTSSNTVKTPSSSKSWFSRGKSKQAAAQPAPTIPTSSSITKRTAKPSDEAASQNELLSRRRQAVPSNPALDAPIAKTSTANYTNDGESRRRNVLKRKPSSIDQRSRYAHTESSTTSDRRARAKPEDTVSSPDTYADHYPGSVFGVALPTISASSSYLPTRGAEPSYQATSSSRMAAYNTHRAPKTPTPQLLPPLAPSFANSSGSSTRRSESPGSFSRTSTPTSISSYSPGIPITSKSPLRARQISPTRSRPPVTRNWHGNGSKQDLGVEDTRGLSVVQEMGTSPSSSDTVRGNQRSGATRKGDGDDLASALAGSSRHGNSPRAEFMTSAAPQHSTSTDLGKQPRNGEHIHEPTHDSFTHVASSASQHPSKTPPPRPTREGTPRLEDIELVSPVIRSNLNRLKTTGHKRRDSSGEPIPASIQSSRLPSPNPTVAGSSRTWPSESAPSVTTTRSGSHVRAANHGRESSPVSAKATKPSRFSLFSRRASPSRATGAENLEKFSKKGPAAGTGHEGYGKYARRGRSGSSSTSVNRGRSTSSNATASSTTRTSNSRKSSMMGREGPEMDDFLRDRLSPVIISGGRISSDRNNGAELYRTTSGASSSSIAASDDSSFGTVQTSLKQPAGELGSTMIVNSTVSSRRGLRSLPQGSDLVKSVNDGDGESKTHMRGDTLAARRSLHRSQLVNEGRRSAVPDAINTRAAAPSSALSSRDTVQSSASRTGGSMYLADDISEGREGNWLKAKKHEKPAKSPSKWNFLQRANGAHHKSSSHRPSQDGERPEELPVAITRFPEARSVAHYAMIDSSGQNDDTEGLVPNLKDIDLPSVSGSEPILSHRQEAWRRQEYQESMLLPSPPTMTGEFTNFQSPPSPKILFRQPEPVYEVPAAKPKPKEPRLQQVGRIPRVVSKRDRQHKPPPQSFSRPFPRGDTLMQSRTPGSGNQQQPYNPGRPALGVQTDVIPCDPWGESASAKPASAPARHQAQGQSGLGDNFLVFPQRYNSGLSGSSSSGTMSFVVAAADNKRPTNPSHGDDVWNEYDDFLDVVEPPVNLPTDSIENKNKRNSPPKNSMAPAPLRIRKDSAASSIHNTSAQELPPITAAPSSPLPSPPSRMTLLTPNLASSPLSFSEFIAGYGDRNRGSTASKRQSSVSGSHYSQASMQSVPSEAEQKRNTQIMAEKTRNSSGSQSNLRFSALMTSRWLSFGRVLFSPAHDGIQATKQDRVLVLDGLGNDDWSFYCALTYPDATVYNLSSFKRMGTASARRRELGTVQSPSNHRQIFHAGMSAPFPFPKGYFSAAVFRFPTATTEAAYYNAVSECKRVLRPGGYLEISILDLDMVNMGNRARRAVRALKVKMQVAQSNVSLKPLSDDIQKMLGRRGFENLSRCMVTVPVAGLISDSRAGSLDERDLSFGEMLKDPSPQGDESITKMVSRVGRWWKAKRDCQPCDSVVFRHQQNASMNSPETRSGSGRKLDGFYAYKDTFGEDSVWVDIPENVTFINIPDPYAHSELDESLAEPSSKSFESSSGDGHKDISALETAEARTHGLDTQSTTGLCTTTEIQDLARYSGHGHGDIGTDLLDNGGLYSSGISQRAESDLAPSTRSLDLILNPVPTLAPALDSVSEHSERILPGTVQETHKARESQFKASTETDQKTAFFLRHFSEVTGPWMDLFDQTTFFGSYIPVKSISNPLLKNAACAYAAKQLARVRGRKAPSGRYSLPQVRMQTWERDWEDWALLAAQYYDKAISLLMEALQWDHISSVDNSSEEIDKRHYAPRTVEGMVEERKLRRRQFGSAHSTASSDDLLAATAILCEYESLDASNAAWAHHLSGTKSLLDVVEVGMVPMDSSGTPFQRQRLSQARKATFWNFARQDLFAAYVHDCRTRLDTEDVALWRDAGLVLDDDNLVVPSNRPDLNVSGGDAMREDMTGNALIWLVSKLVSPIQIFIRVTQNRKYRSNIPLQMNLLCVDETSPDNTDQSQSLSAKWTRLSYEMEVWFNGLPETFMPSAILPVHPHDFSLTEVWSSIPVCAATIMTWHMAQVLMLVNKPPDVLLPPSFPSSSSSSMPHHHHHHPPKKPTFSEKFNSYRHLGREITYHGRQILGICLARPSDGARIHALQPLFVAGQCLTDGGERRVVVDLLRAVERDLGWATEYRVRQLLREWGDDVEG
ncbi:MAG: hypothetical protein Q9216_003426 [Gyalolechia sp. 2 TL-2023]